MSYIDAYYNKKDNVIQVWEQTNKNNGKTKEYVPEYVFYFEDPHGIHRTMWDQPCSRRTFSDPIKFRQELKKYKKNGYIIHESDIPVVFRCLDNNYKDGKLPHLNIAFFDIESDFHPVKGFAPPENPFNRITTISVYVTDDKKMYTFILKPDVKENDKNFLTFDDAEEICNEFENCYLCDTEEQLLECFFDTIENVNIVSGWNSSLYDIPYIINRCKKINQKLPKRFCRWDIEPTKKKILSFGKEHESYDIHGRVHLDYLLLYKKHNTKEQHSYKLDHIGEIETGERKVAYEGNLDKLYKEDFRTFIDYSRQDVMLLVKIDEKKKYIQLSSQIAHQNRVLFPTTLGSVSLVEQAITHEVHSRGMVVPTKKTDYDNDYSEEIIDDIEYGEEDDSDDSLVKNKDNDIPAIGAYVAKPKIGIHKFIGCVDINSLYPSTIRSLNMSLETIIGQARTTYTDEFVKERLKKVKANLVWNDVFSCVEYKLIMEKTDDIITFDFINGNTISNPAKVWHDMLFSKESQYILSANATLFRKDVDGVIPKLLERWYAERKVLRKRSEIYGKLQRGILLNETILEKLK